MDEPRQGRGSGAKPLGVQVVIPHCKVVTRLNGSLTFDLSGSLLVAIANEFTLELMAAVDLV